MYVCMYVVILYALENVLPPPTPQGASRFRDGSVYSSTAPSACTSYCGFSSFHVAFTILAHLSATTNHYGCDRIAAQNPGEDARVGRF